MSILKVNTLEEATSGGATFFTAKAWVNLNGIGTVAINGGGNVSSITDNTTGDYTLNFTAAIEDANYTAVLGGLALNSTGAYTALSLRYSSGNVPLLKTTTQVRIASGNPNLNSRQDQNAISVNIIR